ncbi:hypothetical protein [Foetidibacter luteolus]|uniref:hypothetical protein n=1 Tax=Foetidibacter luteolus TaxID=2608880 RepID=UPI00129B756B|nr:hypothetical protein [Foetidibacter luteolus]
MENVPLYVSIVFALTALLTIYLFYRAAGYSKKVLLVLTGWLVLQAVISLAGFYTDTSTLPPKFLLAVLPPMLLIITLFIMPAGKRFIDSLNIKTLTLLHVVRIPVEIALLWLFVFKTVPVVMTFEGRNFDIVSGISAPVVYYLVFKKNVGYTLLLAWNIFCLLLLINIVSTAVLSTPYPFQKFGFEQPNIAIFHFPFIWLPSCVVPLVLLAQLAGIRKAVKNI